MTDFKTHLEKTGEVGEIVSTTNAIIKVSGLPGLKLKEMIITENGDKGIVFGLEEKTAEILMFDAKKLEAGKKVVRTDETFKIPVNQNLLGRIINPLCQPIDGLGPIGGEKEFLSIEREAPNISQRVRVNKPLETGVTIVDFLVPIGYGQRELVIGDGKTGKTTFLLQTVVNQAKKGTVCIYVSIGKESSQVKVTEEYLKKAGVFENVIIIAATPDNPSTIIYLAPYSGMSIAEYFRDKGKNSLVIFDELTTHAKIYREISSLLKRVPGRAAYPGDIFHIQASLIERAGNIKNKDGGEVSITALPVAETLENDLSGYIQTNLMAMTDGHIFFDINEFKKNKRPAINAFLSVSRVGNQAKESIDHELAALMRKNLAEYQRNLEIARFGVELPEETRKIVDFGDKLGVIFNQEADIVISREFQMLLLGLLLCGFWDDQTPRVTGLIHKEILNYYKNGKFSEVEATVKKVKTVEELKNIAKNIGPAIKKIFLWPI